MQQLMKFHGLGHYSAEGGMHDYSTLITTSYAAAYETGRRPSLFLHTSQSIPLSLIAYGQSKCVQRSANALRTANILAHT